MRLPALAAALCLVASALCSSLASLASPAQAAVGVSAVSPDWCAAHGSNFVGWVGLDPDVPICGPGPGYGGSWNYVDLPGPFGANDTYYNATPGFQCVELAERYLAVIDGLAPVHANGSSVALNYHAAYPRTSLVVNASPAAIGHAPEAGDVISFSSGPDFGQDGDGHVAVVVRSQVDGAGDGSVVIAQENVSPSDYLRTLSLVGWQLEDPQQGTTGEYQFPYAEWLGTGVLNHTVADVPNLLTEQSTVSSSLVSALVRKPVTVGVIGLVLLSSTASAPIPAAPTAPDAVPHNLLGQRA